MPVVPTLRLGQKIDGIESHISQYGPESHNSRDGTESLSMKAKLATKTGKLPAFVQTTISMKAMVLLNLATEVDITNETRGHIQDIILDEWEGPSVLDEDGVIKLKYPLVMILFKPDKKTKLTFEGLLPGVIPLTPSLAKFSATGRTGKTFRILRWQYAMTAGYAFTDYKSQGQTIEYVIIDIGKPPTGHSRHSPYVALSRSRGRDTIQLLRDFDNNLYQNHPSEALRREMTRLKGLNNATRRE